MDCEKIDSTHHPGYGRNFKYRKKVYNNPIISLEYPAFKEFDSKFRMITYKSYKTVIGSKVWKSLINYIFFEIN